MAAPEFSRPVRIDTLGVGSRSLEIGADQAERSALARRFGLQAIDRLSAELAVSRSGAEVRASGTLRAEVTQTCVATGEAVPENLEERFDIVFRPGPQAAAPDEEVELSEGELDVVFYDGASVDVGEAVAETLLLSLNPYPRSAKADSVLAQAGVKDEEEARAESSPFAALRGLGGPAGD